MIKHAASTENVEHCVKGISGVVKAFSSASVTEEFKGLIRVCMAKANAFENLVY